MSVEWFIMLSASRTRANGCRWQCRVCHFSSSLQDEARNEAGRFVDNPAIARSHSNLLSDSHPSPFYAPAEAFTLIIHVDPTHPPFHWSEKERKNPWAKLNGNVFHRLSTFFLLSRLVRSDTRFLYWHWDEIIPGRGGQTQPVQRDVVLCSLAQR